MKKFLSLVLALVMTMSLVTVSAGAKDFSDDGSITYKEAVDVISGIGVVDGYSGGDFKPTEVLTRGAAAKIICNLILGPTTASYLSADTAPFKDVPVTNVFAGYITYCSQQGIINGYADGTFRPTATLSGNAFMKMLLGALGYDAEREGYVGANWSVQVAKTALGIELDEGLVDDFNGLKAVTREEACLYAFNTLSANMVRYGETTNVVIGDAQVSVTGERRWDDDEGAGKDNIVAGDGIVQFAERYFTKLVLNDGDEDAFGRPSNTWTYKNDKIGTYAKTADATYTKNTAEADIYSDIGMTSNSAFTVYVDGIPAYNYDNDKYDAQDSKGNYTSEVVINKGEEDDKIGEGNGAIVEVFKEDRIITIINTYVGEVVDFEEATSKRDAYIELGTLGDATKYDNDYMGTVAVLDNEKFDTEAFEVGDIVTFTYSLADDAVKSVKAAESVTGDVESFTTNKKFSMDGTSYEYGAKAVNYYGSSDIGTQSTVYMDENGYVLYAKEGADNLKNYALVLNAGPKTALSGTDYQAYLLYTDGTTAVVDTDKAYYSSYTASTGVGSGDLVGQWVTYKTNSKGEVVLTNPTGDDTSDFGYFTDGYTTTALTKNGDTNISLGGNALKINSATVVIVKQGDDFKVYEGVKGIPTITNGTANTAGAVEAYSAYATGTFQKLVYIDLASSGVEIDSGSDKVIFLVGDTSSTVVETASDKYYVFDAVVDGELMEDGVMLDYTDSKTATVIDTVLKSGASIALDSYSVDNGFYTVDIADKTTNLTSGTIEKVSGNCIDFDGAAYYTADDCVFFRVDADGNLRASSINGVRTDDVGAGEYYLQVFYTVNNDAELTGVYWVYNR